MNADMEELVEQLARETRKYIDERLADLEAKHAAEFAAWKASGAAMLRGAEPPRSRLRVVNG